MPLEGRTILNKIKITGCYKLEAKMCLTFRITDYINVTIPPDTSKRWEKRGREKKQDLYHKRQSNKGNRRKPRKKCKKE